MTVRKTVEAEAKDKTVGMTVAEIAAFCQEVMRQDMDADQPPRVRTGWRSQITSLKVPK